jgi:hypothetical protein
VRGAKTLVAPCRSYTNDQSADPRWQFLSLPRDFDCRGLIAAALRPSAFRSTAIRPCRTSSCSPSRHSACRASRASPGLFYRRRRQVSLRGPTSRCRGGQIATCHAARLNALSFRSLPIHAPRGAHRPACRRARCPARRPRPDRAANGPRPHQVDVASRTGCPDSTAPLYSFPVSIQLVGWRQTSRLG